MLNEDYGEVNDYVNDNIFFVSFWECDICGIMHLSIVLSAEGKYTLGCISNRVSGGLLHRLVIVNLVLILIPRE